MPTANAQPECALQSSHVFSNVETTTASFRLIIRNELQSSHVFSNVETYKSYLDLCKSWIASIEPRFFKRGNRFSVTERFSSTTALQSSHVFSNVETGLFLFSEGEIGCCFNRATFFQTWKRFIFKRNSLFFFSLQSSHVFSNVETTLPSLSKILTRCVASIEPRFFKRGNCKTLTTYLIRHSPASIEPRFFKRGNCRVRSQIPNQESCFNRATFFQTWKLVRRGLSGVSRKTASIEPRFFKRGNHRVISFLVL